MPVLTYLLGSTEARPTAGNLTLPSDIQRLTSEMLDGLVQARDGCGDSSASKYLALGSRDVLESLGTAKRRCENLNRELVRQAQSHEELVGGVAAVKDANKRLLEQTQFQRDELETIAQQGVADEQRLQISAAKHANDYSSCQTESSRHLAAARSMASHRLAAARLKAADKLRTVLCLSPWPCHDSQQHSYCSQALAHPCPDERTGAFYAAEAFRIFHVPQQPQHSQEASSLRAEARSMCAMREKCAAS